MDGDRDHKHNPYDDIPIPSYDEATASLSSSSRGPEEVSDDAERQGLLHSQGQGDGNGTYQPPTVESARSSVDSDLRLPEVGEDDGRRPMEEFDYLDPMAPDTSRRSPRLYHRARLRPKFFAQSWSNWSATLSSIRLPSFRSLYSSVPVGEDVEGGDATSSRRSWLLRGWSIPDQYRMTGPTAARLAALLTIGLLVYVLFTLDVFPGGRRGGMGGGGIRFDPESIRAYVQDTIINSDDTMPKFLEHITSYDHVAGTEGDLYLAKWMEGLWAGGEHVPGGGFDRVALLNYYVYLNYPTADGRHVQVMGPEGVEWTAALEEDVVKQGKAQSLAWHGYSKSGEAQGSVVFANNGMAEDFDYLLEQGVVLNGTVALIRSSAFVGGDEIPLGLRIKAAEDAGCVGVLAFTDPTAMPANSAWKPADDTLRRDGASPMNIILGDPLTPGFASTLEASRNSKDADPALPGIPSLPLAWRDASHLLSLLDTSETGIAVPDNWRTIHSDTKTWSGTAGEAAGSGSPEVQVMNKNDENPLQQIWNLHGMIHGAETPEKKIMVGSHRDSFCFGSVSPGSSSAIMLEVINIFGDLRRLGWRPLRTIEFSSWDAGEWGSVGSTEYVEGNIDALRQNAVAYINVDAGVWGPDQLLRVQGSPLWQRSVMHALDRVNAPHANASLSQVWDSHSTTADFPPIADSDVLPFQYLAGTSSLDLGFRGRANGGYPHGSCHETYDWMTTYGDPDFSHHKALAQVWALIILEAADAPLLPFDIRAYALGMQNAINSLQEPIASRFAALNDLPSATMADVEAATQLSLQPLTDAAAALAANADTFHKFENVWSTQVYGSGGFETTQSALQRLKFNDRLADFETDLLDLEPIEDCPGGGMPGRCQYKHTVFGPTRSGKGKVFPGVMDAVDEGDWERAVKMVQRAAGRIRVASRNLVD